MKLDYATLRKLVNPLPFQKIKETIYPDPRWVSVDGLPYDFKGNPREISQYLLISEDAVKILKRYTSELILYSQTYDIFVWCVDFPEDKWNETLTEIEVDG